jgi:hypothetical protein
MAKKQEEKVFKERVIALCAGGSGVGKSFFIAGLRNALIFDTDLGGGLAYADRQIHANGSERIEVGSYTELMDEVNKRRRAGALKNITTLAVDHLTTLQQEAINRHNPNAVDDFGRSYDKATREWRKIRELVRFGDFNLFCTAHMKSLYEKKEIGGLTTDASKNIEADFSIVLYLKATGYPATATIHKWRRLPDDPRGAITRGQTFPFTMQNFVDLHGCGLDGKREEIAMATPEQVKEMERMLEIVKLPEGTASKWLAKAKAESWSDFPQEDLGKCLDYLKGLMNGQTQPS